VKLYTRPRALFAGQLRITDQVAMLPTGDEFVSSEAEYMDLDLRDEDEQPVWCNVHNSTPNDTPDDIKGDRTWVVVHSRGVIAVNHMTPVITRETIELDPWTYVKMVDEPKPKPKR
jgi:hypothetical protein